MTPQTPVRNLRRKETKREADLKDQCYRVEGGKWKRPKKNEDPARSVGRPSGNEDEEWPALSKSERVGHPRRHARMRAWRLEADDNPGGEPEVILRAAPELGEQVVSLNDAPREPVGDLGINAAAQGQGKGGRAKTGGAIMRAA